jgi:hypothetical protein
MAEFISMEEYKLALIDLLKISMSPKINRELAKEVYLKIDKLGEIEENSKEIEVQFDRGKAEDALKEALKSKDSKNYNLLNQLFSGQEAIEEMILIMMEECRKGLSYGEAANNAVAQRQLGNVSEKTQMEEDKKRWKEMPRRDMF